MLILLFHIQICTYNITVPQNFQTYIQNLEKDQEICIFSTISPYFIAFNQIPQDAIISYYTLTNENMQELYYQTLASNIGFALRSLTMNSSFSIRANTPGTFIICAIGSIECSDGILLSASSNSSFLFDSNKNFVTDFFSLSPSSSKCILLSSTSLIDVNVDISIVSNQDFVYKYQSSGSPQRITGNLNFSFHRSDVTDFFFFSINTSSAIANRFVNFKTVLKEGTEPDDGRKTIIYGIPKEIIEPPISEIVEKIYQVSQWLIICLSIIVSLFFIFLIGLAIKFDWCRICCDSCRKRDIGSSSTTPLPPSAFMTN